MTPLELKLKNRIRSLLFSHMCDLLNIFSKADFENFIDENKEKIRAAVADIVQDHDTWLFTDGEVPRYVTSDTYIWMTLRQFVHIPDIEYS